VNTKFLDKVVDQILSETKFNFKDNIMVAPWHNSNKGASLPMNYLIIPYICHSDFSNHCRRIYSVGKEEMGYVIKEYKKKLYLKMRKESPKKYLFL
jgi:hypothetical protein